MIEHISRGFGATTSSFVRSLRALVVRLPGHRRAGPAPVVVLQGHLDVVRERRPDSSTDPTEGRIGLFRDGDWLMADGTTLGADNGIGIAAMMALAEDASLPHGPLELPMTVNEEIGGLGEGASGLDPSLVTRSTLLNLDSEEDGTRTVCSVRSTDTEIRVEKPARTMRRGARWRWRRRWSRGSRRTSRPDIARGRANAIKVLGRALRETLVASPFRLGRPPGGTSANAILRDATATCSVSLVLGPCSALRSRRRR